MNINNNKNELYTLGIDVGLYHMGLVGCKISKDFKLLSTEFCELVDITNFKCDKGCMLFHSKGIADYMTHFFKNYSEYFNKADYIIIERQPPMGLVVIQELIMFNYRAKCILVSPNSMHAHYGIGDLDYESRKIRTIKLTEKLLYKFESYQKLIRKHDVADALCITKYYLFVKNLEYLEKERLEKWKLNNSKYIKNINEFAYNPI